MHIVPRRLTAHAPETQRLALLASDAVFAGVESTTPAFISNVSRRTYSVMFGKGGRIVA